jgi:cysteine desulfuration protein SufE
VGDPATSVDDIRDAFALFDSWEDRYRFVIDLGKSLPALPEAMRTEDHLVRGCQSQVWLVAACDDDGGAMHLQLDSDAHIVRGLIAIVLAAYDGLTPQEIVAFDIEALFAELDLLQHLSVTRGNGLRAMVARIRETAAACRDQPAR